MTGRDRIVAMVVAVVVVLAAAWLLAVSPERQKAAKLQTQVAAASSQLAAAESQVANAHSAQSGYAAAYASLVNLGKAVPPGREVPSLVYQLALASNQRHVEFSSIASATSTGSGSTSTGAGSSSSSAATASTSLAGFTQMPFTFVFTGTFVDLYKLFGALNNFTVRTASGGLRVRGRLLTIQSAKLAPAQSPGSAGSGTGAAEVLTGTITATAYVLPATQGLTGGATSASPASGSSATPASSSAPSASSPAAPAVVRAVP